MHIYRFLDTAGNGTGTKNANTNTSVAADDFYISGPTSGRITLVRMIISIRDDFGFSAEKYGALAELTNGVGVSVTSDGTTTDLLDGVKVKTNEGWGRQCFDVDINTTGTGDDYLVARWTFAAAGKPLVLSSATDKLVVTTNDDLTGLVEHYFMVQGYRS